jgi:hypothetical protein
MDMIKECRKRYCAFLVPTKTFREELNYLTKRYDKNTSLCHVKTRVEKNGKEYVQLDGIVQDDGIHFHPMYWYMEEYGTCSELVSFSKRPSVESIMTGDVFWFVDWDVSAKLPSGTIREEADNVEGTCSKGVASPPRHICERHNAYHTSQVRWCISRSYWLRAKDIRNMTPGKVYDICFPGRVNHDISHPKPGRIYTPQYFFRPNHIKFQYTRQLEGYAWFPSSSSHKSKPRRRIVFDHSNDGEFWSRTINNSCSRKQQREMQEAVKDDAFIGPPGVLWWSNVKHLPNVYCTQEGLIA